MLILGASGGVGTATVQVVKAHGGRVIACAGSDEKCAKLKKLGADHVINYSTHDFSREAWRISGKKGVDICVNFTGGDTWNPSIRTLKQHGKLLTCGATAGFDARTDIRYIWQREVKICGSNGYTKADVTRGMVEMADGKIKPPEVRTFPMSKLGRGRGADGVAGLLRQDRYDPGRSLSQPRPRPSMLLAGTAFRRRIRWVTARPFAMSRALRRSLSARYRACSTGTNRSATTFVAAS